MQANGRAAKSTDPSTWTTFDDACDALILGDFCGIGFVLGEGLHGIDLDDCIDENGLSPLAQEILVRVDGYAEISPSGTGLKILTRTDLERARTDHGQGVELYLDGRYFALTGHRVDATHAEPAREAQSLGWLVERVWGEAIADQVDQGDAFENLQLPLEGWDLERVAAEVLPHLDPNCGYEDWLRVGQALHHQGQADEAWLELWDGWSEPGSTYAQGVCAEKWRSFGRRKGRGVTLASLLKETKPQRVQVAQAQRVSAVEQLLADVAAAPTATALEEIIAPQVRNLRMLDVEREQIASAMQAKAREFGQRLPITRIRTWLRPRAVLGNAEMPDWARGWVYITDGDKFFNLATKQEVTAAGFRALFNRHMPARDEGGRERADAVALEQWDLPVVAHKAYMPNCEAVFEMFGLKWANLYRPESVPSVPAAYSAEDLDAIATVEEHFRVYLADQRERDLLLSIIAHNVQHPGTKIRWAPYIHGVPGDGKSFFSELVGVAMGAQNVRMLNGSTLESNFTDWAVGYALVAIEEMKQHGHNRYDIMNRVKPFITNSAVEVHPKGKASYTAPNVSNYMIFSNYLDGAPVDEGDRRYMFVSSQLTTEDAKRLTEEGYFKRLFESVQEHPGAIRRWLLEYPLHPEFDANGRAPDTAVKHTVVEMSKSDLESSVEDLIERGAVGVTRDVISSAHLTRALSTVGGEPLQTSRVNTMLTRLGYRFAVRVKWRGEACRLWIRQGVVVDELGMRELLDASSDAAEDFLR
jgi:hypothetical protein